MEGESLAAKLKVTKKIMKVKLTVKQLHKMMKRWKLQYLIGQHQCFSSGLIFSTLQIKPLPTGGEQGNVLFSSA